VSVRESLFVSDAIALSQLITATATGSIWRERMPFTPESEYSGEVAPFEKDTFHGRDYPRNRPFSGEPYITELLSLNPDVQP
jgi:hypothetical protein